MSRDNPLWGTERIRGELLKLGIIVSNRSIRRYRLRRPTPIGTQRWRTFLLNEIKGIWAADLFVVQTVGFRTLYVLFFITHVRRELVHFNVTANPQAAWIWQQFLNATPWGRQPSYLIHDRDAAYGKGFGSTLARLGVREIRTPVRAPRANFDRRAARKDLSPGMPRGRDRSQRTAPPCPAHRVRRVLQPGASASGSGDGDPLASTGVGSRWSNPISTGSWRTPSRVRAGGIDSRAVAGPRTYDVAP